MSFIKREGRISFLNVVVTLVYLGLLTLSAYAVLQGLFDLIAASQSATPSRIQTVYIAAAAVLITLAMGAMLEVTLRRGAFAKRTLSGAVYVLLALWSIGFGYGFWWKIIAARTETLTGIENAGASVQREIQEAETAAQRLEGSLEGIRSIAATQQAKEVSIGSSCGPRSRPGDGIFSVRRRAVTTSVTGLIDDIEKNWIGQIGIVLSGTSGTPAGGLKGELARLDPQVMRTLGPGERATVYRQIRDASATALAEINSVNQRQGAAASTQLDDIATKLGYRPGEDLFTCYDPELARALSAAADRARRSPSLVLPTFENNEGAAATAKAFGKIWDYAFWVVRQSFAHVGLGAPSSPPVPLSGNDVIALIASCAIDICIFVFGLVRVRRPLDGSHLLQHAPAASRAKLSAMLGAFAADDRLEAGRVFNACIMRAGGHHYLILPRLSRRLSPEWRQRAMFLQNVLLVLKVVRAVDRSYEPTGIGFVVRSLIPYLNWESLFADAATQSQESMRGDASENIDADGAPNASELSLHRFWPGDLLELLMMMREDPKQIGVDGRAGKSPVRPTGIVESFPALANRPNETPEPPHQPQLALPPLAEFRRR